MELVQSFNQSVFARAYETSIGIAFALLMSFVFFLYSSSFNIEVVLAIFFGSILVFLFATGLLYFTTPTPYRKICFYEDRLEYFVYDRKRVVDREKVLGFKVTQMVPKQFIIEIEGLENIKFGYYDFSKEQRNYIMKMIEDNR